MSLMNKASAKACAPERRLTYREAIADGYYALKLPAAVREEAVQDIVNFFRDRFRQLRTQAVPTEEVVKESQKK